MKKENDTAILTAPPPCAENLPESGRKSDAGPQGRRPALEKAIVACFLLLIAYSAVRSVYGAEAKRFWNDEVYTVIVARQPNVATIWRALKDGADGQPPLFYLVERVFDKLIPNQEIAFRAPSILGFCVAMWCLFVWLKRRYGALIAAVAGIIPFLTMLYDSFAVEARPYALLIACIAVALCCYQRVPGRGWTIGLGASLMLAQAFHYYAILAITPFVAAEAVFWLKTRWLRRGVWVALACPLVPLAAFWPLMEILKKIYGGSGFWAQPLITTALGFYSWLFHFQSILNKEAPATGAGIIIELAFCAGAACAIAILVWRGLSAKPENEACFHELILIGVLLSMPMIVHVATRIGHGGETERYMLAAVLGLSMASGYAMKYVKRRIVLLVGGLLLFCICVQETSFWIPRYALRGLATAEPAADTLIRRAAHPELPVVISEGLMYLPAAYYEIPKPKRRLVALADPQATIKYAGFDTIDKSLLVLKRYTPFRIYNLTSFRKEYPAFLLYSRTSGKYYQDWWPRYFAEQGYSMQVLAARDAASVYLVDLTKVPATKQ